MSFIFRPIKKYAKELRSAPAAQYAVSTSAPAVTPSLTPSPPPSYQPRERTPTYRERDPIPLAIQRAGKAKKKIGIFDRVTQLAGSRWTFLGVLCLLALWAVVGAINGPSDTWQVIFQDVSSIQCYISATLLMRQQQNSTRGLLTTICSMISRSEANERMMAQLSEKQLMKLRSSTRMTRDDLNSALELKENIFDRLANAVAHFLGSLLALAIYWAGIIVWFFLGFPLQFSNTWQLYVNTATALSLTFCTMFLQSVRRQHEEYLERCLRSINIADEDLEMDLREMTGDISPNPIVAAEPIKLNWIEKFIDIWAFVLGGSLGVILSVSVTVAWLSVGNLMQFDDNWWLIIGTYTGLMGFIDGFVLRNVHSRETAMADKHFERLLNQDFKLFYMLEIPLPEDASLGKKRTIVEKISYAIGHMVEVPIATLGSVAVVIGLLSVASAMQWTETGQLLCNTPTMIVEGFLLLMLISGHNGAETKRRRQYTDVLQRRLALDRRVSAWDDDGWALDVKLLGEKGLQAELEKYSF